MKRVIMCSSSDTIDVSEYNDTLEDLYEYILDNAPIKPSEDSLHGKGMTYLQSDQPQVYSLTFRCDPDIVDGGFELRVGVNSYNIARSISSPPKIEAKIITFLSASNASQFRYASDTLMELFKFADSIRRYANSLF